MKISSVKDLIKRNNADLLMVPFFEGEKPEIACEIGDIERDVRWPIELGDFKGKEGETLLIYLQGKKENRVLLIGLGEKEQLSAEKIRLTYACAIKECHKLKTKKINTLFPAKCKIPHLAEALLEGLYLTNYYFNRLRKESLNDLDTSLVEELQIVGEEIDKKIIDKTDVIVTAVHLVRDLVNNNADDETPQKLAAIAKELEKLSPKIHVTVFDKERLIQEKMDLLLAVNRGSFREPSFSIIEYLPNKNSEDRTILIGKGITYDSGGLSLKPTEGRGGMNTMKSDMSGAAAVLGVMYCLAKLNINKNVIALIPATENSIGSKSYKPGDVYSSYSGKTVEVVNTDAEGRLILADAISYAVAKLKPSRIIDIASLTGAIVVALGEDVAGLFSNDQRMTNILKKAAEETGEFLWEMPLFKDYRKMLKSDIADIKNVAGREGSAITAALFLEDFAKEVPWAHIDIGGSSYFSKPRGYNTTLGTGYGTRLLIDFIEKI